MEKELQIYNFKCEEKILIKALINAMRLLLKRVDITSKQIYLTSLVLRALERMPLITPGIGIGLSLINRDISEGNSGYQSLNIDEECVEFSTGENIYSPGIGNDHQTLFKAQVGVGWRTEIADFVELEDWVVDLLNRAKEATIELSFEDYADSTINWYDDTEGDSIWQTLSSDYD